MNITIFVRINYWAMLLRNLLKCTLFSVFFLMLTGCELFEKTTNTKVLARVHEVNLYEEDLKNFNIPKGLSEKDSVAILMDYINDWATKQLILHEAKKNMTEKKQREYNTLVEEYKLDLFSSAYENAFVKKSLKTGISSGEIETYYNKYKESFLLQEDLVNVRYIHLSEKYKDLPATRRAFKRFNNDDKQELKELKLSFIESDFNLEKKWISFESILAKIPSLRYFKKSKILRNDYFLSYKSEEDRFFVKFEKILKAGQSAPIEHVEEQIKQIILNKRKIKLKKQLEEEIRKDALQTKEYQIFE